eukprot:TRINITY_DN34009_c0_g1_i1.p1 TRINITY_DN34009_c0_g1~~TRINITY_DN34009_c0_g1_i1.p1  ORF type:complete len:233 (+),score=61.52 TRINITY_DN34009_c0_g1_i1:48-701(+)
MGSCSAKPAVASGSMGATTKKPVSGQNQHQHPIENDAIVQQLMSDMNIPVGVPVQDAEQQQQKATHQNNQTNNKHTKSPIATAYEQNKNEGESGAPPTKSVPSYPEKPSSSEKPSYPEKPAGNQKSASSSSAPPPNSYYSNTSYNQGGNQQNVDPLSQLPGDLSNIVAAALQQANAARANGAPNGNGNVFTHTTTTTTTSSTTYSTTSHSHGRNNWM